MSSLDTSARSSWSLYNEYTTAAVSPASGPLNAALVVPGSKSFTNRAILMAAFASGTSALEGILKSDDSYWCVDAMNRLGLKTSVEGDRLTIVGAGSQAPNREAELFIGAAGTTARFLPGLLALSGEGDWTIRANQRMSQRPIEPLITALCSLGADITYLEKQGCLPIRIRGRRVEGGEVSISGKVSSQFISGLIMAAPLTTRGAVIRVTDDIVQHAYVQMTIDMMKDFGVQVQVSQDFRTFTVAPQAYQPRELVLEADASTSCYFFALGALTAGRVTVKNISGQTRQPDILFLGILERLGCSITHTPGSGITVEGPSRLKGGLELDLEELSDQALTVGALAVFASGPVSVRNVGHIRNHESDRISVICESLGKLGIQTEEYPDGFKVYPGNPVPPNLLESFDDHRVAMSLALIGSRVPRVVISDPACVSKTCPNFFDLLRAAGLPVILA